MWDRQITVYTPILHLCCACNTEFKTLSSLREHISLQSGEKPYRCHMCEEELADAAKLKCHIRMHTGREQDMCNEKPHKCDKCSKQFATLPYLVKHIQMKHSEDKPYKCEVCQKQFSQASYLKRHTQMRSHISVLCVINSMWTQVIWKATWYLIQERKHTHAIYVLNVMHNQHF